MDQDAFRKLLATPGSQNRSTGRNTATRGSLFTSQKASAAQQPTADASKSEFKPRKIKKKDDQYRDRAAERRTGVAGDFAEVEAVLESFEKQHKDDEDRKAVEEQRRYLGGDSEHTVLVKGLDFALLEQTRARAAVAEDDDILENAFQEAAPADSSESKTAAYKKRRREDIIQELKNKRTKREDIAEGTAAATDSKGIEDAKKTGKFKPIGFKPIGSASKSKVGKDKDGSRKQKKRKSEKVKDAEVLTSSNVASSSSKVDSLEISKLRDNTDSLKKQAEPDDTLDENFDIFADAGEYEGINYDDEDDDEKPNPADSKGDEQGSEAARQSEPTGRRRWFDDEPPSPRQTSPYQDKEKETGIEKETALEENDQATRKDRQQDTPEPEKPTRLAPLASSAVPSIRDMLDADTALDAEEKRRARKEKRKSGKTGEEGKKVSSEAKLNRDFQKLKSYTEKKGHS